MGFFKLSQTIAQILGDLIWGIFTFWQSSLLMFWHVEQLHVLLDITDLSVNSVTGRSEVLTTLLMKIKVSWCMTLCWLETVMFHDSTFSQITSKNLPFSMVHYPRKLKFSFHAYCADSVEVWHCIIHCWSMNIVHFIQRILCSVGIIFTNRLDDFIQLQELQFRILQPFWSCSK